MQQAIRAVAGLFDRLVGRQARSGSGNSKTGQ
jgi:hypothetical protein